MKVLGKVEFFGKLDPFCWIGNLGTYLGDMRGRFFIYILMVVAKLH